METLSLIAIPERSAFAERDKTFICIGYSSHKCIATLNGFAPLNQAVKAPCLYSLATGLYGFIAIFMATVLCFSIAIFMATWLYLPLLLCFKLQGYNCLRSAIYQTAGLILGCPIAVFQTIGLSPTQVFLFGSCVLPECRGTWNIQSALCFGRGCFPSS